MQLRRSARLGWLASECAFVLIFHVTLLTCRKVKGKGMMNFKCRQEDPRSRDSVVGFPGSEFALSSTDALLMAVKGPVCLYQHLATILFFFSLSPGSAHKHTRISSDEFVHQRTHLFLTISHSEPTLPASLCTSQLPALPHFSIPPSSALVISRYI